MKFQCNSCDTRYSISDERVRGKILKIRCKTCGAIIAVEDPALAEGPKTNPAELTDSPQRPPTQNEPVDEWYVSIDGDQAGPLDTKSAKEWVGKQDAHADLFCWKEGFDDWLNVEDVAALKGLRAHKKDALFSMAAKAPSTPSSPFVSAAEPADGGGGGGGGDDLFEVAEVSRVVRLPDLANMGAPKRRTMVSMPAVGTDDLVSADASASMRVPREHSRRAPVLLGVLGAVAVIGIAAAILTLRSQGDSESYAATTNEGGVDNLGRRIDPKGVVVDKKPVEPTKVKRTNRSSSSSSGSSSSSSSSSGSSGSTLPAVVGEGDLSPDDILRQSRKSQFTFTRCYEQARKKDPFLKVSKLTVKLSVNTEGKVTSASVSQHGDSHL